MAALENHYLKTVKDLDYSAEPARAWVAVLIAHLQEQLEEISEHSPHSALGAAPKGNFSLADKLLTRIIAAVVLTVASPLIGFIWIGLKLEHSGPVIELRKAEHGSPQIYSFVLGSGHVSRFVRRANLQSLPSLWHLLNGDTVLRLRDLARIVQFPSSKPAAKITDVYTINVAGQSRCRRFRRFGEFLDTITYAVERLDHIEVDVASLEFLAEPLDVAIDGPVVDIDLVVVCRIHQGIAAFHNSRPTSQRLQDEKFGDCERDRHVFPRAGVALRVHTQQSALQNLVWACPSSWRRP